MNYIDLRSDTVSVPTDNMLKAMQTSPIGDDVYDDDPTAKELEDLAAKTTGKEAALFCPSGTMANQLAIMTHTRRGDEIIAHHDSHIIIHEVGAASVISQVGYSAISSDYITAEDVKKAIRPDDIHAPSTGLLCLENALGNGTVIPLDIMAGAYAEAKKAGIPTHLDGARLFNAAIYLEVDPKEIAKQTDTLMFCLSKGLCAPVGSMLCGSADFIKRARKNRKLLGGGMRQIGGLCGAGILAITEQVDQLKIDHDNAKYLATELSKIPGIIIDIAKVHINMVFFDFVGIDHISFMDYLLKNGVKANNAYGDNYRFVTHRTVTRSDIDIVIKLIKDFLNE